MKTSTAIAMFTKTLSRCSHCQNSTDGHECTLLYLERAISFLTSIQKQTSATDIKILIELSNECLFKAFRHSDSYSDYIYCITNVNLAVLLCTTGHFQAALEHCGLTVSCCTHQQCHVYALQTDFIPEIDTLKKQMGFIAFIKYFWQIDCTKIAMMWDFILIDVLFKSLLNI